MAERRMVSTKIVESAKFLKMSLSAQALYFHLLINADDDGIVEAFNVLRIVGANEGDFQCLINKEFIIVLNDDLVTYLPQWLDHNKIRSDRKIDSVYQNLLLEKINGAKVLIPRQRTDRIKREFRQCGTEMGRPNDNHGPVEDRLVEDSIVKYSIGECKHDAHGIDHTHTIYQDRKSQWFPANEWLGVDTEEISKAKKCFKFWVDWYEPSRRGNINNLRPIWEQKCQEIGIDNFLEKFGHAFAFYCGTPEVQKKKIIMSAKKFLEEYDNWFDQAEMDGFKPVKFWERMNNHASC